MVQLISSSNGFTLKQGNQGRQQSGNKGGQSQEQDKNEKGGRGNTKEEKSSGKGKNK